MRSGGYWLALTAVFSCSSDNFSNESPQSRQQDVTAASADSVHAIPAEGAGTPAIALEWQPRPPDTKLEALTAVVENTTPTQLAVELVISMQAPDGQAVEQVLWAVGLEPRQKLPLTLRLGDLPLQSAGVATTLDLFARYEAANAYPLAESAPKTVVSTRTVITRAHAALRDDGRHLRARNRSHRH